ncbi:MAG: RraA family protein [Verrucomicrobiota bacterium]
MKLWQTDAELFVLVKQELFTCVVGDILDKLGRYHQFLPPKIQALREDMVVIGRALPVLAADTQDPDAAMKKPFGRMLEALDDLKPGEVYVNTGSSPRNALWGGLMSTRAQQLGAAGVVVNGYVRDTREIYRLNYPTFCFGRYGQDSAPRYQVVDFRVPIEIGDVRITPGDIIYGDIDGVLVVPRDCEAEVFRRALEKARGEKKVKQAIEAGMSAVAAFKKYGIM